MKQSQYNSYDDLPLFLNADMVAKVLGVSSSTSYELMLTTKNAPPRPTPRRSSLRRWRKTGVTFKNQMAT